MGKLLKFTKPQFSHVGEAAGFPSNALNPEGEEEGDTEGPPRMYWELQVRTAEVTEISMLLCKYYNPISQLGKTRLQEFKQCAQSHITEELGDSWNSLTKYSHYSN